jgi:hypothetical protein
MRSFAINDPNDPDGPNDPDEPKERLYREYIQKSELAWFKTTGKIISRAISGVYLRNWQGIPTSYNRS